MFHNVTFQPFRMLTLDLLLSFPGDRFLDLVVAGFLVLLSPFVGAPFLDFSAAAAFFDPGFIFSSYGGSCIRRDLNDSWCSVRN